jgi:hypothetical protein
MLYSVILINKINITISICKRFIHYICRLFLLRVLPLDTHRIQVVWLALHVVWPALQVVWHALQVAWPAL